MANRTLLEVFRTIILYRRRHIAEVEVDRRQQPHFKVKEADAIYQQAVGRFDQAIPGGSHKS